jgi:hypothetical protein
MIKKYTCESTGNGPVILPRARLDLALHDNEINYGIVFSVVASVVGAGAMTVQAQESLDGTNWTSIGSPVALAAINTEYTFRISTGMPLKTKLRFIAASYDSGTYTYNIFMDRRSGNE